MKRKTSILLSLLFVCGMLLVLFIRYANQPSKGNIVARVETERVKGAEAAEYRGATFSVSISSVFSAVNQRSENDKSYLDNVLFLSNEQSGGKIVVTVQPEMRLKDHAGYVMRKQRETDYQAGSARVSGKNAVTFIKIRVGSDEYENVVYFEDQNRVFTIACSGGEASVITQHCKNVLDSFLIL